MGLGVCGPASRAFTSLSSNGSQVLSLSWQAGSAVTYAVQSTTNLATGVWEDLGDWTRASDARQTFTNLSDAVRFYRVTVPHSAF